MRTGHRIRIAERIRHRHRLLENRDVTCQRQRIEQAGHAQFVGQQAPAQGLLARAIRHAIQRFHGDEILLTRAVQRERSHGLVAGAFGVMSGAFPMTCTTRVVGQRLQRVFAISLLGPCQQRGLDALMQCLTFVQADESYTRPR